jgi:nitrous oxidase accessory protein NosD
MQGTYAEQVVLESRGAGAAPITLRGEGTARPTVTPASRAPGAVIFVRGNWHLENLHVDVNEAPMAAIVFHVGADGARLTNSELRDGRAGAGVIIQGARNVTLEDNVIHHFIKPGDDSHGVVVVGPSRNTTIRNNNIHHNSGDSVQCQAGSEAAETLLVQGNELHDNGENGVDIKQCYGVTVRDNQIYGFPNPTVRAVGTSAGEAVLISRGARDVLIQGNDISRAGRGISVLAQVAAPQNIRLEGNTIQNIRNFPAHNGQGIRIAGGSNVLVADNVIEGTTSYGLMLAADGIVVPGLTVRHNRVRPGPNQLLLRLGREAYRPGLSMSQNHYGRNGALSMDGVQDKFRGRFADYRDLFVGEHLPLSSASRMDVWRLVIGVDQGSDLLE